MSGGGRAESEVSARLRDLVDYPQEALALEIKTWLDLADDAHRATLAKALIALANHGGGHVLIGFVEKGSDWRPAEPRPSSLAGFSQDLINGIVHRYAEPVFHCQLHFPARSDSGLNYPVISVPPGRVAIRSKRNGPGVQHISMDTYYIRRPGPSSESPQSGLEWDELVRRCVLASRDRLLDDFRLVIAGSSPLTGIAPPGDDSMSMLVPDSMARWTKLTEDRFGSIEQSPYRYGWWTGAYIIDQGRVDLTIGELLGVLNDVPGYTGWRPWWIPTRPGIAPYQFDGAAECWLAEEGQDAAHADFWRAKIPVGLFLLRGYQEDPAIEGLEPAKAFDLSLPIWRVGEVLMHASNLSRALGLAESTATIEFTWNGLQGRRLVSVANRRRDIHHDCESRQSTVSSRVAVVASEISGQLPELVRHATAELYSVFGFFKPPDQIFAQELRRMTNRADD